MTSPRVPSCRFGFLAASALAIILALLPGSAAFAQGCAPLPPYAVDSDRIGMNVVVDQGKGVFDYDSDYLGAGWFLDYRLTPYTGSASASTTASAYSDAELDRHPSVSSANALTLPAVSSNAQAMHNMGYAHTLRTSDVNGDWRRVVEDLVSRYPGLLLILGNEPDRRGLQDDLLPGDYAEKYHDVYEHVKKLDPTANVAIAGIVQPTPLRLIYLEKILSAYKQMYGTKMPIDVWTVHAFILREVDANDPTFDEFENWGAGIPPGVEEFKHLGIKYEVSDHGDVEILKQLIRDFRLWMAQQGYRHTPLLVTEFGILMRPDYDAGDNRVYDDAFVKEFMRDSFAFFQSATDSSYGMPGDDYRLVQAWSWYALNNTVNGFLVEHDSGTVTPVGEEFAGLTDKVGGNAKFSDFAMRTATGSQVKIPAGADGEKITLTYTLFNRGNIGTSGGRVEVWIGDPSNGGTFLAGRAITESIDPRCREVLEDQITVTLPALRDGPHVLTLIVKGGSGAPDTISENNKTTLLLQVGSVSPAVHVPALFKQ